MSTTPPTDEDAGPRARGGRWREAYEELPWPRRELIIFGPALLFGVFLVPLIIWAAGNRVLGPYTHAQNLHAGPGALLGDFLTGLAHGSAVFWAVALGPAAFIALLRLLVRLLRLVPPRY